MWIISSEYESLKKVKNKELRTEIASFGKL